MTTISWEITCTNIEAAEILIKKMEGQFLPYSHYKNRFTLIVHESSHTALFKILANDYRFIVDISPIKIETCL